MSSDSDISSCTPPEIRNAANTAIKNLLPDKSKRRYELVYSKFMDWCRLNKIRTYSENCLLAYFQTFSSKKSLWSTYSMLKSCLLIHNNVDISKFTKFYAFLKKETHNLKPKKSKVLESHEIDKFIHEAPDNSFLLMKAVVILGISGACRRDELCKMLIDHIEFKHEMVLVNVPETKTNISRRFVVINPEWINLLLKYKNLRVGTNKRFFLTYRNVKCINSPIGLNTIGKIPCSVAQYLQLEAPQTYTGHCFRRSSATLLANNGGDLLTLKKFGGWRSSSVAEGYVDDSVQSKINVAERLMQPAPGPSSQVENYTISETLNVSHTISKPDAVESSGICISNCTNCTINVYNNNPA